MITDLAEVLRLGNEKAAENLEFRRYLTARHTPDEPFQILASEVERRIDCRVCANCCKQSVVAINQREVEAIAQYLGSTVKNVLRFYTTADTEDPDQLVLKSNEGGCVFLDDNLCMIYDARPRPCREFPHVRVGGQSLGNRQVSHGRWAPLCPIIYNSLELYKRETGFKPDASSE